MSETIKYVDRVGTNCNKWDNMIGRFGDNDLMALWVADMDFVVPECARQAAVKYAEFGIYGYYKVPDSYYQAFIDWEEKYHNCHVEKEWIRFSPGVVSPINWYVNIKTQPGEAVLVTKPVYYPFLDAIENNGRKLVSSDLVNVNGVYTIDFADFEKYKTFLRREGKKLLSLAFFENHRFFAQNMLPGKQGFPYIISMASMR